jgi:hypothetical protein
MSNSISNLNHQLKIRSSYLLLLICLLLLNSQPIFSQLIFEDVKGEEVLIKYLGGSFLVNSANDSIKIGYAFRNKYDWCFGIDVAGKAENGIASLLKNGDLTPNVKINFNIGFVLGSKWKDLDDIIKKTEEDRIAKIEKIETDFKNSKLKKKEEITEKYNEIEKKLKKNHEENQIKVLLEYLLGNQLEKEKQKEIAAFNKKSKKEKEKMIAELNERLENYETEKLRLPMQTSWLNLKIGYEKADFKIFSPEASFDEQIKKKEFNGFSFQLSYQSFLYNYAALINFSLGFKRTNNISELKKVELTDEIICGNSGQTARLNKKSFIAWQGSFETFNMGYILLSSFWKPSQVQLGVLTYGRYNYSRLIRSLNLGLGGYILKAKESNTGFVPIGGILVEYEDKFDSETEVISFGDRFTVSLVLNIPFLTK